MNNNIYNFDEFIHRLFEFKATDNLQEIKKTYSIGEDEWKAMTSIPEEIKKDSKLYKFYKKGAKDFVKKIIKIVSKEIFEDPDNIEEFMLNIAAVESCFGTNPNTYNRPLYTKGIFQLDKTGALKTIGYKGNPPVGNGKLKKYISDCKLKVKEKIGLDWDQVPYESISKPLYNAIAARIFIGIKERSYTYNKETGVLKEKIVAIPEDKEKQAKWWKDRYNTSKGRGTEDKFINPSGCLI